jgi:Poly(ADP-ribose) polymerase catalytic domain
MFGSGLYFADTFLKSSGYCNDYTSVDAQPYSLLMLCEVALGKTFDLWESKFIERSEEDYLSTKGMGKYGPDPTFHKYNKNGVRKT